jgi:hypothetical protein
MTISVHDTAIKVDVYPDEFKPIMKALKYVLLCDDSRKVLTENEWSLLNTWLNDFSDVALNEAI